MEREYKRTVVGLNLPATDGVCVPPPATVVNLSTTVLGGSVSDITSLSISITAETSFTAFLVKGDPSAALSEPVWSESVISSPDAVLIAMRSSEWGSCQLMKFDTADCHIRVGDGGDLNLVIAFAYRNSCIIGQFEITHGDGWAPVMAALSPGQKPAITHGGPHNLGQKFSLSTAGQFGVIRLADLKKLKKVGGTLKRRITKKGGAKVKKTGAKKKKGGKKKGKKARKSKKAKKSVDKAVSKKSSKKKKTKKPKKSKKGGKKKKMTKRKKSRSRKSSLLPALAGMAPLLQLTGI